MRAVEPLGDGQGWLIGRHEGEDCLLDPERAFELGLPSSMLLVGDPGSGKSWFSSRLVREAGEMPAVGVTASTGVPWGQETDVPIRVLELGGEELELEEGFTGVMPSGLTTLTPDTRLQLPDFSKTEQYWSRTERAGLEQYGKMLSFGAELLRTSGGGILVADYADFLAESHDGRVLLERVVRESCSSRIHVVFHAQSPSRFRAMGSLFTRVMLFGNHRPSDREAGAEILGAPALGGQDGVIRTYLDLSRRLPRGSAVHRDLSGRIGEISPR